VLGEGIASTIEVAVIENSDDDYETNPWKLKAWWGLPPHRFAYQKSHLRCGYPSLRDIELFRIEAQAALREYLADNVFR
jgi:hypothetical protein